MSLNCSSIRLICCLTAIYLVGALEAQVEGVVTDASGTPMTAVSVWIGNGHAHTHTDELGRFGLPYAVPGDTLRFSFLGFEEQRMVVDSGDLTSEMQVRMVARKFQLEQVRITAQRNIMSKVASVDLKTNPVTSSQEVLQTVPGLFIGQHAGGGKAEQIFLRGFDVDHGTDVGISVDGVPVNMVSHAHGQGYADLHFVIPETVAEVDFGKGPYYADKGNFTTAGYVDFETIDNPDKSLVGVEMGQFNTMRLVSLLDLLDTDQHSAYVAAEYLQTDGPFAASQNFSRLNFLARYSSSDGAFGKLSLSVSHFTSNWDASGQIPVRALRSGMIGRFGAIDDTEGGITSRTQVVLGHTKALSPQTYVKSRAFYTAYDFELYSNFTFFLHDPVNGDQIRQREDRNMFGFASTLHHQFALGGGDVIARGGIGLRADHIHDNELSRTVNRRTTLQQISFGDVEEINAWAFADMEFAFGEWLIIPGLRIDRFDLQYDDALGSMYTVEDVQKITVSPKMNVVFTPKRRWQLFLKTGVGFHSNDARVVVAHGGRDILPQAVGVDIGTIWKPAPRLLFSAAVWYLYLEQEFVYVGDEGVVEPSSQSRRLGFDFGMRYQIANWIFFDADVNYAFARSIDDEQGQDYIPLAADFTATGGLSVRHDSGMSGGIRCRYIADRPANEDNTIVAEGYFVTDINLNYTIGQTTFGITVDNVFDTEWNETQFATESRLQEERESVEEIHFTPGTPLALRGSITLRF